MREPEKSRDARLGTLVGGRYELLRVLGRGGTGTVFEARHRLTGAHHAVKILRIGAEPDEAARMVREARALAKLDHPHIVRLIDCDAEPGGSVFIVQELLEGRTLRTLLDEELTLTPARALEILGPVLDALAYAHARGIVHRDVKPENIILGADRAGAPCAKLIDFGLARDPGADPTLTRRGAVVGTPKYMSPEQAWGRDDVDARSDVWSFGVVLYECLAGHPPYEGANDREVLASIVAHDPPDLHAAGVGVDAAIAEAVMGALTRAPEARCPSATELSRRLGTPSKPPATGPSTAVPTLPLPPPDAPRARRWYTAAAVMLVVLFVLVAASFERERPGVGPARMPLAPRGRVPAVVPAAAPTPVVAAPVVPVSPVRLLPRGAAPRVPSPARPAAPARGTNAAPIVDEL